MGENKDENTKIANQAWRKRPRKFAPKSRLGCKTCKIRRVKCDLAQPSCVRCQCTGRTCDGYSDGSLTLKTDIKQSHDPNERLDGAWGWDSHQNLAKISPHHRKQWQAKHPSLVSQNLRPFMILPATGLGQTEAMCFFEYISIKHLNEYYPCESWRNTLMYFTQTVPAVRYAATALSLVQRDHVSNYRADRPLIADPVALHYYNRAIQLVLAQDNIGDSTELTAITLLVCYLFTCFDQLAGNYTQAMLHLRGGVELSRNVDQALLNSSSDSAYNNAQPSGPRALIRQVATQIRRLDLQAVLFLTDWTPADIQETLTTHSLPLASAFQSPEEASEHLNVLVARAMRLRWTEQETPSTGDISAALKETVLRQIETWHCLFDNMLRQSVSSERDLATYPLISLLRLQYNTIWTYLSSFGPGREMEYDAYLPQFEQCLAMASEVAEAHELYSGSLNPTFTPEIGIVPILYIIGAKCRHPRVRRDVLRILRRQPIREAVWNSISAAKVVELIVKIEEGGRGEGQMIESMEQIQVSQRVEIMWWTEVVRAARVDVRYTMCMQETEWHTESLMM